MHIFSFLINVKGMKQRENSFILWFIIISKTFKNNFPHETLAWIYWYL